MRSIKEKILSNYDSNNNLYKEYEEILRELIAKILDNNRIKYQKIESRIKNRESLEHKIISKDKYQSIEDIKDILGLRIILFYNEDIDICKKIVEKEFESDIVNVSDKREHTFNEFGYSSLHLILRQSSARDLLLEYKKYSNIYFELQIRTILQHAWAEIEHDLGYKASVEIPPSEKRSFARLAGLIELADDEFSRLKRRIDEVVFEGGIFSNKVKKANNCEILVSYVLNNAQVNKIAKEISMSIGLPISTENHYFSISTTIGKLESIGLISVSQITEMLTKLGDIIEEFAIEVLKRSYPATPKGVSITNQIVLLYLVVYLILYKRDRKFFDSYCKRFNINKETKTAMLEEYEKIANRKKNINKRT